MNDQDMHSDGPARQRLPEIRTISFHGDEIVTFEADGKPHVAMRRIVENMGLAWAGQHPKLLEQRAKFMCHDIMTHDSSGRRQSMLCMPLDKLPLWLATINPNKIRDVAIRAKVEEYQAESAIALHDYWTKGAAIKGDHEGIVTGVDPAVMKAIGGMVKSILQRQLKEAVPAMVEHAMLEGGHVVSTDFKPALEVLKDCKVPPRKRRSFSQRVSSRLRRFSTAECLPLRLSRETGRYLFHVDAIKKWLAVEGSRMIHDHVAAVNGQGVLHLVTPTKPKGQKGTLAGLALLAAGCMAGTLPQPAKALPAPHRDGIVIYYMGGRPITVDTQRFDVGQNERVLCVLDDGRIGFSLLRLPAGKPGSRRFWEDERPPRPGEAPRAQSVSGIVTVLGAVVG